MKNSRKKVIQSPAAHRLASGKYRFARQKQNYEDYSSGRVFYGSPGATNFPVRLTSEIFQRCAARLNEKGMQPPYVLYDPCCGGGYSATVAGYLHGDKISKVYASDISNEAVELACRNLSLLNPEGLRSRIQELQVLVEKFNKQSHLDALESSLRLQQQLESFPHPIETRCFQFDILGKSDLSKEIGNVDLILTDLPYGQITRWQGTAKGDPVQQLLNNVRPVLNPVSVIALTTEGKRLIPPDGYEQIGSIKIGKRRTIILEPTTSSL